MKPGAMVIADREIVLNEGKETRELLVANVGDRPVQVGSHYHFFEVNRLLPLTESRPSVFGWIFPPGQVCVLNRGRKRRYGWWSWAAGRLFMAVMI